MSLLTQFVLSCSAISGFPPGLAVERVAATAHAESGLHPTALHDNTTRQSFVPDTQAEAIALATTLRAEGHSIDAGLMQVNDANWTRLGLTAETVFEPQRNVCAGMQVLAEAYAIERRVSCRYNTGRPDCSNGYPDRIEGSLRRVRTELAAPSATASPGGPRATAPIPPPDPFVAHTAAREMHFPPAFLPAAPRPKADTTGRTGSPG